METESGGRGQYWLDLKKQYFFCVPLPVLSFTVCCRLARIIGTSLAILAVTGPSTKTLNHNQKEKERIYSVSVEDQKFEANAHVL